MKTLPNRPLARRERTIAGNLSGSRLEGWMNHGMFCSSLPKRCYPLILHGPMQMSTSGDWKSSGFGDECERSVHRLFGGRVARYHMVISRVYKRPTPYPYVFVAGPNKHDILLGLLLSQKSQQKGYTTVEVGVHRGVTSVQRCGQFCWS